MKEWRCALTSPCIQRNHARSAITRMLNSIKGEKILVLDKSITGPLGMLAEMSMLKKLQGGFESEVQNSKRVPKLDNTTTMTFSAKQIFHLGVPLEQATHDIVYLVRPTIENMNFVADQVHKDYRAKPEFNYGGAI
eukprot:1123366-Amorphochlora_amoeboformis.AAC.2